jgi:hypothetical protein
MPGDTIGAAWVSIRPNLDEFSESLVASMLPQLAKIQTIIDAHPLHFRADIDMTQATAQVAQAATVMQAAAAKGIDVPVSANLAPAIAEITALTAAGGAAGGGGSMGILGGLLWGSGGAAGFASFGSIASLAGFGFEHVLTTGIGLVGSFAGALGGLGVLASGVFGKMAVGMGSDMVVMSSTIADTKSLYDAYTAIWTAQITYGKNSTEAAAATAALNTQMGLLSNTAGVQAEAGLAKAAFALNIFWDKATSSARVAAVGFITPFITIADTYIPLIASAATRNFGILTEAFKPFIAWANGPQATGIFQNLENIFASSIPAGVGALTQFVELLSKIANWAAPKTGSFMKSLDDWLTNLNSAAGFTKVEGFMTTLVGMFHDWWDLLKQIGITIYDLFSKSVGLGTTIVTTITGMLKTLDTWLESTSGAASVKNLFTVHLHEIQAILAILPTLLSGIGQIYLILAPALTSMFTIVVNILSWISKIPSAGPLIVWAGAVALFASKMQLWTVGAWILDLGKLVLAFAGLATSEGFVAAMKGLGGLSSAAFGGGGSGASAVSAGLGVQKVFVTNWAMMGGKGTGVSSPVNTLVPGAGLGAEGAGAALTGSAGEVAGIGAGSGTLLGVGAFLAINSITESLLKTQVSAFNTAASSKTASDAYSAFSGILAGGKFFTYANGQQEALSVLGKALTSAGLSGGNMATAVGEVETLMKAGKISTATDIQTFIDLWNANVRSSKGISSVLDTVNGYVAKYGALTTAQMQALELNIAKGVTSAFDIYLSLKTANENLANLPASAKSLAGALASLAKAIPGIKNLIGGGLGSVNALAAGGMITEPVLGFGLKTGKAWSFAETQNEYVLTAAQMAARQRGGTRGGSPSIVQNLAFYGTQNINEVRQEIECNNARLVVALRSI